MNPSAKNALRACLFGGYHFAKPYPSLYPSRHDAPFPNTIATCRCVVACTVRNTLSAAEIRVIEPGSEPVISGKELDWIYGDYLMKNDQISLIIAAPLATRDANMTIRNIGGSILDLTLNHPSNDQLSAYTPAAGRYLFHDPSKVTDRPRRRRGLLAVPLVQVAGQRRHDRNGALSSGGRRRFCRINRLDRGRRGGKGPSV